MVFKLIPYTKSMYSYIVINILVIRHLFFSKRILIAYLPSLAKVTKRFIDFRKYEACEYSNFSSFELSPGMFP